MEFRSYQESEFEFACSLRGISSEQELAEYLPRFQAVGQWNDHYLDFVIDVDGTAIGEVQLRYCDKTMPDGVLEFGIEIAPKYQGLGHGTHATNKIAHLMFNQGFHRISGSTDVANIAMQRVFVKSGWTLEGTLHGLFLTDGVPCDYLSYSCTKFMGTILT